MSKRRPIPGVNAPVPPTDPARAALYAHPRPTMQIGHNPHVPPLASIAPEFVQQQQQPQQSSPYYPPVSVPHVPPGYRLVPEANFAAPQPAPETPRKQKEEGPPIRGLRAYKPLGRVMIGDTEYGLRDLDSEDAFAIYDLLEEALTWGIHHGVRKLGGFVKLLKGREDHPVSETEDGEDKKEARGEAWILAVVGPFLGVRYVKAEIKTLIASIFLDENNHPLAPEDLERIPWRAYPDIRRAILEHPDVQSFFGWLGHLRASPATAELEKKVREVAEQAMNGTITEEQSEPS